MSYLVGENMIGGYGAGDILKGCTISAERGQISVVVGPNGAGKSTAMKALLGMLKVLKGKVHLEGEDITRLSPQQRVHRGMAFVPQTHNVFVSLTVEENLHMGGFFNTKSEIRKSQDHVYELFPRLKEREHQRAGTMSGGEQQMLAIGRALMSKPRMIILDEPSLGLAPIIIQQIFEIIGQLREEGITVFLVEQNAHQALSLADRGYVLETGRIRLHDTGKNLLANPEVRDAYLGG